jgi:hypothetical protein
MFVQQNTTRLNEYKLQNPPDINLTSSLFLNGNFRTWAIVWSYFSSQNRFSIPTTPFLQQTSYDKWEAEYLFDGNQRDYSNQNITYEDANLQEMAFSVTIPRGYTVQDPEYRNLATDNSGSVIVTKQLQAGETFHLTVTNDAKAEIASIAGNIIIAIGVFSSLLSFFYGKIKQKTDVWRKPKAS